MGGSIQAFGQLTMTVNFDDLEKTLCFYRDVLGWRVLSQSVDQVHLWRPMAIAHVYLVPEGKLRIDVKRVSRKPKPKFIHSGGVVESLSQTVALCKQYGFELLAPWEPGVTSIKIKSPDGRIYNVTERAKG